MSSGENTNNSPYLSVVEVIGLSLDYLAGNWRSLLLPALMTTVVIVLMTAGPQLLGLQNRGPGGRPPIFSPEQGLILLYGIVMFTLLGFPVAAIALHVNGRLRGREISMTGALVAAFSRAVPVIICSFVWTLLYVTTAMALFVPSFVFLAFFAPVLQIMIIENVGPIAAFRRSMDLTRGMRGRVALTTIMIGIIHMIISLLFGVPVLLLSLSGGSTGLADFIAFLVMTLVSWPVLFVMFAAMYLELWRQQHRHLQSAPADPADPVDRAIV